MDRLADIIKKNIGNVAVDATLLLAWELSEKYSLPKDEVTDLMIDIWNNLDKHRKARDSALEKYRKQHSHDVVYETIEEQFFIPTGETQRNSFESFIRKAVENEHDDDEDDMEFLNHLQHLQKKHELEKRKEIEKEGTSIYVPAFWGGKTSCIEERKILYIEEDGKKHRTCIVLDGDWKLYSVYNESEVFEGEDGRFVKNETFEEDTQECFVKHIRYLKEKKCFQIDIMNDQGEVIGWYRPKYGYKPTVSCDLQIDYRGVKKAVIKLSNYR